MIFQITDVEAVELAGSEVVDFSLFGMFWQADIVVQAVMLLLISASIWSWSIIVNRRRINTAQNTADNFEGRFWSGEPLDALYGEVKDDPGHPLAAVFVAAMTEWSRSRKRAGSMNRLTVQDRISRVMSVTATREMEALEGQVGYLATIGSAAPFVGLFGTVWGIMNSFQNIAMQSDTSLVTVAPGIAEALLATALGLVAAIPAVVAYNNLATDLGRYGSRVDGFQDEFTAILSHQLDQEEG